ncbi:MAG: hypothetical protein R6U96_00055 [Promethearchaeia archaeon]
MLGFCCQKSLNFIYGKTPMPARSSQAPNFIGFILASEGFPADPEQLGCHSYGIHENWKKSALNKPQSHTDNR